ncbi:hypothetical protein QBC47DRAFT_356644 [Echria macrotheca]|uniref:Allergen n=1 Tax=Echria macrotheca TaxID=438768 RepID=A0AAJ0FBY4_9PEZI|nr:hypothetical protein QBC47DRAFT_356644 [Echria macrotheca]
MPKQPRHSQEQGKRAMDLDQTITQDPSIHRRVAITHETIKPHEHEAVEEHIEREIHCHDVYPKIQPIVETEVLPARHFIQDEQGNRTEVAAKDVPLYTGEVQQGEGEGLMKHSHHEHHVYEHDGKKGHKKGKSKTQMLRDLLNR